MNFCTLFQFWVVMIAGQINAYQQTIIAYKDEEIRCLREQLRTATGKERPHFTDTQRARLAALAIKLGRATLGRINTLVTPETLLRWHRELIARKYDGSKSKKAGRPPIEDAVKQLILQLAEANRSWGYPRIVGELAKLGYTVSSSTVANVLQAHGLPPAPDRGPRKKMCWEDFLKAHWDVLAATDFFTVEV